MSEVENILSLSDAASDWAAERARAIQKRRPAQVGNRPGKSKSRAFSLLRFSLAKFYIFHHDSRRSEYDAHIRTKLSVEQADTSDHSESAQRRRLVPRHVDGLKCLTDRVSEWSKLRHPTQEDLSRYVQSQSFPTPT